MPPVGFCWTLMFWMISTSKSEKFFCSQKWSPVQRCLFRYKCIDVIQTYYVGMCMCVCRHCAKSTLTPVSCQPCNSALWIHQCWASFWCDFVCELWCFFPSDLGCLCLSQLPHLCLFPLSPSVSHSCSLLLLCSFSLVHRDHCKTLVWVPSPQEAQRWLIAGFHHRLPERGLFKKLFLPTETPVD